MNRESACTLTDAELADPEFVRAYIESHLDSFDCAMREITRLRIALGANNSDTKLPGSFTNAEDLFVAMGVGDFVWTSAKDKMPSGPGFFLVTDADNELTPWVHRFTAQGKFYGHRDITHWMPLPAAPRQKEEIGT